MPYLNEINVVGIKVETTQNTAATLVATDFCLVEGGDPDPAYDMIPRDYRRQSLDSLVSILGQLWVDVKFKIEMKGSGTAGTALAPLSAAFQSAGMTEATVGGVSVTNAPTSAPVSTNFSTIGKSVTLEIYKGSVVASTAWKHIIKGAVCTSAKIINEAGKLSFAEFGFRGLYTAPTNASIPTTTYSTVTPAILQSSTLSTMSYSPVAQKFEIDFGIKAEKRDDFNSANGIKGFMVVDRKPTFSFNPEVDTLSNQDFFAKVVATTTGSASYVLGSTAGNIVTITMPVIQYTDIKYVNRNGILAFDIKGQANQSSGDDWLSIVYT